MCGLSTPSVPPDITNAIRSSTRFAGRSTYGARATHNAETAYSRVKSLTPPFPSVFPSIARIDLGSILPASIKLSRPETSLGLLVAMRTTPTDVMRILFSPATDMTRYSVHPTAQRIPPPPPRCQSPQKYADDGPAAASSAGILGVEKRY